MKKIAVVLSGCGVFDGSEIHESVACLYALEQLDISYQCIAPNIAQTTVVNHLTNQPSAESRNVLVEAARIARGNIQALDSVSADDFSAAIYPGGFGAALNLCDFVKSGSDLTVNPQVLAFAQAMANAKKPQGFACIAPVMIPKIYGPSVKLTIGNDADVAGVINQMAGEHVAAKTTEVVLDQAHKLASSPAYMTANNLLEVFESCKNLVIAVNNMI